MAQRLIVFILIYGPLSLVVAGAQQDHNNRVPGELIIHLHPGQDIGTLVEDFQSFEQQPVDMTFEKMLSRRLNIHLVTFDMGSVADEDELMQQIRRHATVKLAQFNHNVERRNTPDDPSFSNQWALENTGQTGGVPGADIDAVAAWDCVTGGLSNTDDTIVIAVVDGGANLNHEDLLFWKNRHEIPGNGIDDDNNGYVDDYDGWNAYNSNGNIPTDEHGTHVAGIAAAATNNATGVAGVNWGARIMPIAGSSGSEATVVEAYGYALEMRAIYNKTNGDSGAYVVVTNSSFGVDYGDPNDYPIWCAMYDSMGNYGILSAAATMNKNEDVDQVNDVPTACPSEYMIAVTNTTHNDNKYGQAAYGQTTIDLGAPGTNIYSTEETASYGYKTGTSMATPHVAGAVALVYAAAPPTLIQQSKNNPATVAAQVRDSIFAGVDVLSDLQDITVTDGRLNLYNAIYANADAGFGYIKHGLTVNFHDSSTNVMFYHWDFDNGDTSTRAEPQYTFPDTGDYEVCLYIESTCGNDTVCKIISIECEPPVANFGYEDDPISHQVTFTDSAYSAIDYEWDFGDGNTDSVAVPQHTYADTGTYLVTMIISSLCGTDTTEKTVVVECLPPEGTFTYLQTGVLGVEFNSQAEWAATFFWDFDDLGATDTVPHPEHHFTKAGFYDVCMTLTNFCSTYTQCGEVEVIYDNVNERTAPVGQLEVYPNPVSQTLFVEASNWREKEGKLYIYNSIGQLIIARPVIFENGRTRIEVPLQHYADGLYIVRLTTGTQQQRRKVFKGR